jgi:hypothetical protein
LIDFVGFVSRTLVMDRRVRIPIVLAATGGLRIGLFFEQPGPEIVVDLVRLGPNGAHWRFWPSRPFRRSIGGFFRLPCCRAFRLPFGRALRLAFGRTFGTATL